MNPEVLALKKRLDEQKSILDVELDKFKRFKAAFQESCSHPEDLNVEIDGEGGRKFVICAFCETVLREVEDGNSEV